jgi:hypothetical protein
MRGPAALILAAAVLTGCAPREVLTPKPGEAPAGVDLSGLWQLAADPEAEQRRLDAAVQRAGGNQESRVLRRVRAPDGREDVVVERRLSGGLVHLFLHNGKQLKISQTRAGLFISFDRAVVEEFRFGEHRQVEVGPVIADRVSGWEGGAYVVETLDENRMKLTERYELLSGGDRLRRTIVLRAGNGESATVVQEFRRVDD